MTPITIFRSVLAVLLATGVRAQSQIPSSLTCGRPDSPVTDAPSCNYFLNATNSCASLSDKLSQRACICVQPVFNAIFDCENQLRACYASDELDPQMEEASSLWLSLCKTYITYTPTTPVLTEVTSAFDEAFCNTAVVTACGAATVALDKCTTIRDESSLSECMCQPSILRYDYTCEYMGNITCFSTAAALSNLILSSYCSNFDSVIGTGLSGPTTRTISYNPTTTPAPGSTTTTTVRATSTQSSAAQHTNHLSVYAAWGSFILPCSFVFLRLV